MHYFIEKWQIKGRIFVNDVGSMSLYTTNNLSNKYIVALLNSNILFDYYEFINCSVKVQIINDIKQHRIQQEKSYSSFGSRTFGQIRLIKRNKNLQMRDLEPIEVEIEVE